MPRLLTLLACAVVLAPAAARVDTRDVLVAPSRLQSARGSHSDQPLTVLEEQAAELEPHFDWALNEQCFQYQECELLLPFVEAGKAVFGVEYRGRPSRFCPQANELGFSWLKKRRSLNAWRVDCLTR